MTEPRSSTPVALRSPRLLYGILAGVSLALAALAGLLGGLDTALGALLGSAIAGFNLLGTVQFVRVVLRDRRYKALLLASLVAKIGLTLVVLYLAIVRFDMSILGILLGLSALFLASLIYAAARPAGS